MISHNHKLALFLYHAIRQKYQSLSPNQGSLSYLYDMHRRKLYGDTVNAYDGAGECGRCVEIVGSILCGLQPHVACGMQLHIVNIDIEQAMTFRLGVHNHAFLKGYLKGYSECGKFYKPLIIDPTYKQLFFYKRGSIHKWNSPYTKYLYEQLPPIFVGNEDELECLVSDLYQRRQQDPLHKQDVWLYGLINGKNKLVSSK